MDDFKQRFEIIYKKYAGWGIQNGFKPSKLSFSRFLGVPQGTMQGWEYRGSLPTGKDLKTIHDKLGFSYDWLITGEGEMFDTKDRELAAKDEELAAKDRLMEEKDAEIARLTNMIFVDGAGDKHGSENIGKAAAGQE